MSRVNLDIIQVTSSLRLGHMESRIHGNGRVVISLYLIALLNTMTDLMGVTLDFVLRVLIALYTHRQFKRMNEKLKMLFELCMKIQWQYHQINALSLRSCDFIF